MQLISSLNAGFPACPIGWAELYIRGSSVRATWYSSFEGDAPNSTGANITLDAYGSAEVYVNQLVDVVVKQADGTLYRQFTDGYASPNIEVVSESFTGTDYTGGGAAVDKPTTLQAVLDLWETNSGAPDWKVALSGAPVTMASAFGVITGLVFNVKSPDYGAVGDGVTNDQAAISAALAAAVAAGGGTVFFPKGTYLISTAIEWAPLVNIQGVGPELSIIRTSSAVNARILTFTTGPAHTSPLLIAGVGLDASVSNTGEQIYASAGVSVQLDLYRVRLGASASCVGTLLRVASGGRVRAQHCRFTAGGSAFAVNIAASSLFSGCTFDTSNVSYNVALARLDSSGAGSNHLLEGCLFDCSVVSSVPTALYGLEVVSATAYLSCSGSSFVGLAQPFTAGMSLLGGAGTVALARGNSFLSVAKRYEVSATLGPGSFLELKGITRDSGAVAAYTVDRDSSVWELDSSGVAPALTVPNGYYPGQTKTLLLKNTNAAPWSPVGYLGSVSRVTALSTTAVPNGATVGSTWVWSDSAVAGTYLWMKIAEV